MCFEYKFSFEFNFVDNSMEAASYTEKKSLFIFDACLSIFLFSAVSWKDFHVVNERGSFLHFKVGYFTLPIQQSKLVILDF